MVCVAKTKPVENCVSNALRIDIKIGHTGDNIGKTAYIMLRIIILYAFKMADKNPLHRKSISCHLLRARLSRCVWDHLLL